MAALPTVVLLVPIVPAGTGNGLAMRAGLLLDSLAAVTRVHVVVVPVSGPHDADHGWAAERAVTVRVLNHDPVGLVHHTTQMLADPVLRTRLERTTPLPARVMLAPPTLAPEIAAELGAFGTPDVVLAMRLYLAPLGVNLARHLGATRVVLDADDDDAPMLRDLGEQADADAYERLARCWLPEFDWVVAASIFDAVGLATRAGIGRVGVLPNAVTIPREIDPPPGKDRLLFVGNLTYEPNRIAAERLAREILPLVRARRPAATLELVGDHGGALDALSICEGVELTGAVDDITPHYVSSDVVVAPLPHGAGTRIKVLEAFAHRRPVVATPIAVAGLCVGSEELVTARSNAELAAAVDQVLAEPERATARVDRAAHWVEANHGQDVVAPLVRDAVLGRARQDSGVHARGAEG